MFITILTKKRNNLLKKNNIGNFVSNSFQSKIGIVFEYLSEIKHMSNKEEDFYKKLKLSLEDTTTFPSEYMYKFIIPTDKDKLKAIETIFDYSGAVINTKPSKTGKYNSITILVTMKSADEVISKYKEVATIEGVISL